MSVWGLRIYATDEGGSLIKKGALWNYAQADYRIGVRGVADLVEQVLGILESAAWKAPRELIVNTRGAANYQGLGAGSTRDTTGARSLQLDGGGRLLGSAEMQLGRLRGLIDEIHLLQPGPSVELLTAVALSIGPGSVVTTARSEIRYYRCRPRGAGGFALTGAGQASRHPCAGR
jgi:hypothetical protein